MRVNPDSSADLLNSISYTQAERARALTQLSTGRRINQPSDDPTGAAALVQIHAQQSQTEVCTNNVASVRSVLETADSALNFVVLALQRATTLGVQAASGTLSDSNRSAIDLELKGIKDQVLELSNASYEGNFIFAGNQTSVAPFITDATQANGVRYQGDSAVSQVEVGDSFSVNTNISGDQLFTQGGTDVFLALKNLIDATSNGSGIDIATAGVRSALDHVSSQRVFYGSTMQQLDNAGRTLEQQKVNLAQRDTDVSGADMAVTITNMLNAETAHNALLGAASQQLKLTLFDYISK